MKRISIHSKTHFLDNPHKIKDIIITFSKEDDAIIIKEQNGISEQIKISCLNSDWLNQLNFLMWRYEIQFVLKPKIDKIRRIKLLYPEKIFDLILPGIIFKKRRLPDPDNYYVDILTSDGRTICNIKEIYEWIIKNSYSYDEYSFYCLMPDDGTMILCEIIHNETNDYGREEYSVQYFSLEEAEDLLDAKIEVDNLYVHERKYRKQNN